MLLSDPMAQGLVLPSRPGGLRPASLPKALEGAVLLCLQH